MNRATTGADLARAARALVGVPFRLHGRDPATGLDCIGVLACALEAIGNTAALPNGYLLRQRADPAFDAIGQANGFIATSGTVQPGDVLMVRPGPGQRHLLIACTPDLFVHAHLTLKRVVCGPLRMDWPRIGHWRLNPSPQDT